MLETVVLYVYFPATEEEFAEDIASIEHTLREKMKYLADAKATLPEKNIEYERLYYENDPLLSENAPQLLFEILLAEKELRQFLFANMDIPLCYLIYFIALDELSHFTSLVRQAAMYSLQSADNDFLWHKFVALRGNFFTTYPVSVPILLDASAAEFAHSICKALRLLDAEYDFNFHTA